MPAVSRKGDPVSCGGTVLEGSATMSIGDQGGEDWGREFAFSLVKNPKDKLVLCLPEMAAAQAELENADNRQGWLYLHDFALKWRSRRAWVMPDDESNGGQEPTFIDWDWLMKYKRFRDAVDELTTEQYLMKPDARKKLTKILEKEGAFAGQGTPFDHTILPWEELKKHAFQEKPISYSKMLAPDMKTPDGLTAAMGGLTVYALAAGETHVDPNGLRWITIRKIGRFIHDGFDFNGEQWLGNWECSEEYKGFKSADTIMEVPFERLGENMGLEVSLPSRLDNRAFREFRKRTGYGCDFRVTCQPNVVSVEEFSYVAP